MYILGINCVYHESAVALIEVKNNAWEVLSFVEEERFNRKKRAKSANIDNCDVLPLMSLKWTFEKNNITMDDIEHIATSMNAEKRHDKNTNHKHPYTVEKNGFGTAEGETLFYNSTKNIELKLREMGFGGKFHFLNHHECHSASAYYVSGFSDAVSLVVDGIAEFESTSIFDCEGTEQKLAHAIDYPNSLGFLWEKFSEYVGFTEYDAGKVMGMSAFGGKRILESRFDKIGEVTEDGFTLNDEIIQFRNSSHEAIEKAFGIQKSKQIITDLNYETLIYFDVAATLQDFTEKALLQLAKKANEVTGKSKLCISGGVALNCVANQKILETGWFDEVFIQPASNDAGTALGAALIIANQNLTTQHIPEEIFSPYSKVSFSNENYEAVLNNNAAIVSTKSDDIFADTAQIIANGGIIAWFQGGMELGPRALGNRSIIADARNLNTLRKINDQVKLREIFRPLAPVILKERALEWFDIDEKWVNQKNSPYLYMLTTANVKQDKKHLIPSVIHYDDTARVQVVDKDLSPQFYQLIKAFDELTGVPILTNTSFNIQEPIVCSPDDAIHTFLRSNMSALVMGDYIITKNPLHRTFLQHGKIAKSHEEALELTH